MSSTSGRPKRLPKVFLIRHGPTEWSVSGRHTGTTEVPLTEKGVELVKSSAPRLIGPGKVVDPSLVQRIFVSPRQRAQHTFHLLFGEDQAHETEADAREWTYGDYEGLLKHEAAEVRRKKGLASGRGGWDIWVDGCEGGESPQAVSDRVDRLVNKVKTLHRSWHEDPSRSVSDKGGDVVIVAHGHFSRVFVARWLGLPIERGQQFIVDTASVTTCCYFHELEVPALAGLNVGTA